MTRKQLNFIKEIEKYNYNKDEAYAEIINNKNKYNNYNELEECIKLYFDNIKNYDFTILNYHNNEVIKITILAKTENEAEKIMNEFMQQDIKSNNYHVC